MIDQGRNRAFSLCACNSDDLIPETLEKQFCLGQDLTGIRLSQAFLIQRQDF